MEEQNSNNSNTQACRLQSNDVLTFSCNLKLAILQFYELIIQQNSIVVQLIKEVIADQTVSQGHVFFVNRCLWI